MTITVDLIAAADTLRAILNVNLRIAHPCSNCKS